jgi:hypothetical protein
MRIVVAVLCLLLSMSIFAADNISRAVPPADIAAPVPATDTSDDDGSGYIIGIDLGQADIHYQPDSYAAYLTQYSGPATEVHNRKGLMYHAYVGYRLYRFLGWELGYMGFKNATFNYHGAPSGMTAKRYDYDFLIRGDVLGFGKNIQWPTATVYIKAGMARVNSRFEADNGDTSNVIAWTPIYGVGFGYQITHFLAVNAQWLHTQKVKPSARTAGINTPDVPATNIFSTGIVYRF